ncbi:MAG: peroxiredoxin [Alphaproteobacteria bacterium]|nr:peroxiredoxin [Alphaproteobacteria bacterium]
MTIKLGDRIPPATVKRRINGTVEDISTGAFFAGRKVVLVGMPGAFTPTCSGRHLPGYVEQAAAIKAEGADAIAVLSVNDPYVMEAWGKDQGVGENIVMLADPAAEFTRALGLEVMMPPQGGLGLRGRRFALVADQGIVTHLAIEPVPGLDLSAAEKVIEAMKAARKR